MRAVRIQNFFGEARLEARHVANEARRGNIAVYYKFLSDIDIHPPACQIVY